MAYRPRNPRTPRAQATGWRANRGLADKYGLDNVNAAADARKPGKSARDSLADICARMEADIKAAKEKPDA